MENGKQTFPIFQGIFATAVLSWLGWLSLAHIETDRTQDVVLQRLDNAEEHLYELRNSITALPNQTRDRWHKSEELIYQEAMDKRINRLELFHEPYMWENAK